ncbi:MAG TPA: hypothetical protein VGF43_03015 [Dongiaceae bacterium]|jgi:hypothetical protein
MSQTVVLYKCEATFAGETSFTYAEYPAIGSVHGCILFVSQPDDQVDTQRAIEIFAQWGWSSVEIASVKPIQPESLSDPSMHVFRRHYEECLEHGDSLVWYP